MALTTGSPRGAVRPPFVGTQAPASQDPLLAARACGAPIAPIVRVDATDHRPAIPRRGPVGVRSGSEGDARGRWVGRLAAAAGARPTQGLDLDDVGNPSRA